jgi:hypothetical protein
MMSDVFLFSGIISSFNFWSPIFVAWLVHLIFIVLSNISCTKVLHMQGKSKNPIPLDQLDWEDGRVVTRMLLWIERAKGRAMVGVESIVEKMGVRTRRCMGGRSSSTASTSGRSGGTASRSGVAIDTDDLNRQPRAASGDVGSAAKPPACDDSEVAEIEIEKDKDQDSSRKLNREMTIEKGGPSPQKGGPSPQKLKGGESDGIESHSTRSDGIESHSTRHSSPSTQADSSEWKLSGDWSSGVVGSDVKTNGSQIIFMQISFRSLEWWIPGVVDSDFIQNKETQ